MNATLIIPTLNEEQHIGPLLSQLLTQEPARVLEILVSDGGSTDRTRKIVEDFAVANAKVRLIDNPKRLQASGVNIAAAAANADSQVIIRADAHANYPDDYVAALLSQIELRKCESVVVRLRTVGKTCLQKAVAGACNSKLGTGGSAHRMGATSGLVDHGHHAAFLREAFDRVGGYDPTFAANEDAEFDARLRAAGGRIWFASDIVVDYSPRSTLSALARQYHRYGIWRARNFRKHGGLRLRQLLPPAFLLGMIASVFFGFRNPVFFAIPLTYAGAVAIAALHLWQSTLSRCSLGAIAVFPVIHISWASGFWRGLFSQPTATCPS